MQYSLINLPTHLRKMLIFLTFLFLFPLSLWHYTIPEVWLSLWPVCSCLHRGMGGIWSGQCACVCVCVRPPVCSVGVVSECSCKRSSVCPFTQTQSNCSLLCFLLLAIIQHTHCDGHVLESALFPHPSLPCAHCHPFTLQGRSVLRYKGLNRTH